MLRDADVQIVRHSDGESARAAGNDVHPILLVVRPASTSCPLNSVILSSRKTPTPYFVPMERHGVRPGTLTLPTASRERLAGFIVAHAGMGSFDSARPSLQRSCSAQNDTAKRHNSVHHFLLLLIHRHGERLKGRGIYRHGNPLHSGRRGSGAVPASLFRDEMHEKHLSIDFESQFAFLSHGPDC
jgi:hypothetical protein